MSINISEVAGWATLAIAAVVVGPPLLRAWFWLLDGVEAHRETPTHAVFGWMAVFFLVLSAAAHLVAKRDAVPMLIFTVTFGVGSAMFAIISWCSHAWRTRSPKSERGRPVA